MSSLYCRCGNKTKKGKQSESKELIMFHGECICEECNKSILKEIEESKKDEKVLKIIKTDRYVIIFNPKTGQEISSGINGNDDPFSLDYPSLIDIGIMGHCKNNCEICYQGNKDKPNMTLDNFKKIIDESKDHITQVALGGKGDPNLHENFKEILEYCRLNNVVPNYTTSGNSLTDEQVKISKEFCGAVAVSLIPENK